MKSIVFSTSLTSLNMIENLQANQQYDDHNYIGILDDDPEKLNKTYYGLPVIGNFSDITELVKTHGITNFIIGLAAFKHMLIKEALFDFCQRIGLQPNDAISKMSYISNSVKVGKGQFILPSTSITSEASIGDNCAIYSNNSIYEKCKLGRNVLITGNAFLAGFSNIGDNVYIGPGSIIASGVSIGKNSIVGAGSVVLKDIPENSLCFGNPANTVKRNTLYALPPDWMLR